jgi:hypothetical protein
MSWTPVLKPFPPYLKGIFLILLVLVSLMLTLLAGMVVAAFIFGPGIINDLMTLSTGELMENLALQRYFQIVGQIGTFFVPALAFAYLTERNGISYLKMDQRPASLTLFLSAAVLFTVLPCISWLATVNENFHLPDFLAGLEHWMRNSEDQAQQLTETFLRDTSLTGLIINLLMIGVLAALGEELLFRGVVQRLLNEWFRNSHFAVWTSAIVFSAFHLQFYGFLPRLILGVMLGYMFVWSRSLWVPVIAHLINNSAAVVLMYLYNRGTISTNLEEFGSSDHIAVILFSVLVTAGLMVLLHGIEKKRKPVNMEDLLRNDPWPRQ